MIQSVTPLILPLDAPIQLPSCSRLFIMGVTTHHFILHVLCMLPNVITADFIGFAGEVCVWRVLACHVCTTIMLRANELTRRGAGDARHRVQRCPLPCELPLATRCLCNCSRLHPVSVNSVPCVAFASVCV